VNAVLPVSEPPSGLDEEARRLAALQALEVLDTPPEPVFDAIAASAAEACAAPVALVCLIDARRQWFKAAVGLSGASGTPREFAFCDHAIRGPALFEVADASADPRFAGNPFVTGAPGLRFYAGAPIVLPGGERIGTVCVLDRVPRRLDAHQRTMLECLARIAASTLAQRRALRETTRRLSESEAHYRAIVEDQSELISIARPDGTLSFVNAAFARHFGLTVDAMTGRNLYDFVDAEDLAAVRAHLEATLRGTVPVSSVNRMRSAEGARRWVAWTNRPVIDAEGRATALQSVGRDITEQRLAEERLAAAKRRVRRLYEATPAIMHSIDAEGRLIDVSDRWLALMGYRREEVIGRLSRDFLTPASQAYARDVVLPEFFRTGACDRVAYQFIRSDGKLLDVLLSATLERDAQGAPVRSLAVLEDVTAQKRLEAELGRTHAHLDAVVDNMPALVGYWDAQGVTRFANRDFQAAVGLPIDAIIGCTLAEIIAGIDLRGYDELAPHVAAVLAGKRREFECAMLTTSGLRQLHVVLVPAQAEAGRVDGFYGTWFDITGMKTLALRQRESEQRYRALVEHLGSGYALHAIEVDDEGTPVDYRFLALNPAFCTLFGIEAANAIGARATEVFPLLASDPADWIGCFGHVALTGEVMHVEQRFAGSRRWLEVIAYRTEPGQFAVIAQDITERKRLEADLARLRS
jgi:PAS domain S-box-containing protein